MTLNGESPEKRSRDSEQSAPTSAEHRLEDRVEGGMPWTGDPGNRPDVPRRITEAVLSRDVRLPDAIERAIDQKLQAELSAVPGRVR